MSAFIQAQKIFPPDAPKGGIDITNERDIKMALMAQGIDRKQRAAMIEKKEEGEG